MADEMQVGGFQPASTHHLSAQCIHALRDRRRGLSAAAMDACFDAVPCRRSARRNVCFTRSK